MVQAASKGSDDTTKTTISEMLLKMYKDEGMKSMFQGLGPELFRGVLSAAIMLMIKEKIAEKINAMLRGRR